MRQEAEGLYKFGRTSSFPIKVCDSSERHRTKRRIFSVKHNRSLEPEHHRSHIFSHMAQEHSMLRVTHLLHSCHYIIILEEDLLVINSSITSVVSRNYVD
jgi:hypothetical protein